MPNDFGPAPLLERRLKLAGVPLLLPFGRRPRAGFREITLPEPRISRLWERFSVDVEVAVARSSKLFEERLTSHRIFIVEDGDRYAIRALCAFAVADDGASEIAEPLHDRTVEGLRSASNVLGLALRTLSDEGAVLVRAWSLPHSGSFPIYLRHAFVPKRAAFVGDRKGCYVSGLDFLRAR